VVVLVTPLGCVATVVEDVDVCAKATEPIRAVVNGVLLSHDSGTRKAGKSMAHG
jgi:hypothetical protein